MSHYKIIDSTISILYCARCANEDLEIVPPNRLVCRDCDMVTTFDTSMIRVGQLKGTKYKMRDSRRYSFREITDEAREDAFSEVYVPSPEPGRGRVGWRSEEEKEKKNQKENDIPEAEDIQIRMSGIEDIQPNQGWQNKALLDTLTDETTQQEHNNGRDDATCSI